MQTKMARLKRKMDVLTHYSGGVPRCACCGETEPAFLAIDHVDGGGNKHRDQIKAYGSGFYYWLVKHKFPPGFQVLCHNCNHAKSHTVDGICPHKKKGGSSGQITLG